MDTSQITGAIIDQRYHGNNVSPTEYRRKLKRVGVAKTLGLTVFDERWKLYLLLVPKLGNWGKPETESHLMLFDLQADIAESNNVANKHPNIVERMLIQAQLITHELGEIDIPARGRRASGWNNNPEFLRMGKR